MLESISDWQTLGLFLGLSLPELEIIRDDFQRHHPCMQKMLAVWLSSTEEPTWTKLAEGLKKMHNYEVAEKIRDRIQ